MEIRAGHTVNGPVSVQIQGVCNRGTLLSQISQQLSIRAAGVISNTGQINIIEINAASQSDPGRTAVAQRE